MRPANQLWTSGTSARWEYATPLQLGLFTCEFTAKDGVVSL
jgi:hypothetical protein